MGLQLAVLEVCRRLEAEKVDLLRVAGRVDRQLEVEEVGLPMEVCHRLVAEKVDLLLVAEKVDLLRVAGKVDLLRVAGKVDRQLEAKEVGRQLEAREVDRQRGVGRVDLAQELGQVGHRQARLLTADTVDLPIGEMAVNRRQGATKVDPADLQPAAEEASLQEEIWRLMINLAVEIAMMKDVGK